MHEPASIPKVVVLIVNWERPEDTIQCLHSILASDYANLEIVVVDNGSSDDSVDKIKRSFEQIWLLELPENLGFTGGYNRGIEKALDLSAEFVFLLNNDTQIEANTISLLVDSHWDIAVPKITFFDSPGILWAAGARWRPFPPTIKMIGYQQPNGPRYDSPVELEYATGCALLVRAEVLQVVKGFDARYVNYMEDYDFSIRARRAGFRIGYVPRARVLHKVSSTLGEGSPQRWRYLGRNTVLFYRTPDRFPSFTVYAVLGWQILREVINGNARHLPDFWKGVNEGFQLIRTEA